jgi:hypothetical protein
VLNHIATGLIHHIERQSLLKMTILCLINNHVKYLTLNAQLLENGCQNQCFIQAFVLSPSIKNLEMSVGWKGHSVSSRTSGSGELSLSIEVYSVEECECEVKKEDDF